MIRVPFHAVVFPLFPVLFAAAVNNGEVSGRGFAIAAVAAVLASAICLAIVHFALKRSWQRAALVVLLIAVLFWSYDLLVEAVAEIFASVLPVNSQSVVDWSLSSVCLAIILLWAGFIRRVAAEKIERVTTGLNVAAAALLIMLTVQAVLNVDQSEPEERIATRSGATGAAVDTLPDIYYVILDGYARSDVLRQYYEVDNPLVSNLQQRGFVVADASTSNYFWTVLSLTSSLNMDYVQTLTGGTLNPKSRQLGALYDLIRDNGVAHFLRERGYRYVHFRSTWGATQLNEFADQEIGCERRMAEDEFLRALADASWLRVLRSKMGMDLAHCHQKQFAALARLGRSPGPKFVFAHFLVPHHPYLFDRDGTVLQHVLLSNRLQAQQRQWEDRQSYANQLLYINEQVLTALDGLLKDSPRKPIIIVQSDHGPNLRDGIDFAEQKRVRFANLAAFYLPDAPADLLPPNVTPVNEFRYIFNHYFGAQLPILPVRRFYSDYRTPFAFEPDEPPIDTGLHHE